MGASAGRMVLSLAGAVAGSYWGPAGFAIGGMVGGIIGSLVFPVEGPKTEGARLNDLSVQTSTYGNAIPVGYGTVRISGNIIWASTIREQAKTSGGGKGDSGPEHTDYYYFVDLAIMLAQGPIVGIKRVWANDKLQFSFESPLTAPVKSAARMAAYADELRLYEIQQSMTLYKGTETQLPDPTMEAAKGIGNVPAHRGYAYIVMKDLPLTSKEFANRVPNFEFEVVFSGTTANTSAFLQDSPTDQYYGMIAVDPVTGWVWACRHGLYGNGWVEVIDPNTMTLIKKIEDPLLVHPYGITYQDAYFEVAKDYFQGGEPNTNKFPSSFWVGCNTIGGIVFRIDAQTFEVQRVATGAGVFTWPGLILWDPTYIDPLGANQPLLGRILVTNTNGASIFYRGTEPGLANGGLMFSMQQWNWPSPVPWLSDWLWGEASDGWGYIWMISTNGWVMKVFRQPNLTAFTDVLLCVVSTQCSAGAGGAAQWNRIAYDPQDHFVYTLNYVYPVGNYLTKYDESLNEIWTVDYTQYSSPAGGLDYHRGMGDIWVLRYNVAAGRMELAKINKDDGSDLQVIVTDLPGSGYWDMLLYPGNPFAYVIQYGTPGGVRKIPLYDAPTSTPPTVEDVVQDISVRCGISLSDVNASGLTQLVLGYVLSRQQTGRQAIETLQQTYFFDGVESDYTLKFPARGQSSLVTIPYSKSGATSGTPKETPVIERQRDQDTELPWHMDVRYIDSDRSYKVRGQYVRRLAGNSQRRAQMSIPIVMDATRANTVANVNLFGRWMARDRATIRVSREYVALDPGDVITYQNEAGELDTFLITKTDYTLPGLIELTLQREDPSIYNVNAAVVGSAVVTETVPVVVPTILVLMDIPIVRDRDDDAGFYMAAFSPVAGWESATVFKSTDQGTSYTSVTQVDQEATVGYARTVLQWEGGV